jgi:hypothetical protein
MSFTPRVQRAQALVIVPSPPVGEGTKMDAALAGEGNE